MPRRHSNDSELENVPPSKRRKGSQKMVEVPSESDDESVNLSQISQVPAEIGIIEKITLKNFMCHEQLTQSFGPNVNFIIGRNGSGKSAVLTAIMVALGGRANTTSRGNSLKNFIQTKKLSAEVSVTLSNRGEEAFKPDSYGKSITVERRITSEGSSSYKIKNAQGQVVSNKREELDNILDQFYIQVDNPVSILTQDTSRNFLHSKNDGDKYKFFLKATQLEQLEREYNLADESREVAVATMREKDEGLPRLEKDVEEWERRMKMFQGIDELREKTQRLKNELAWALIQKHETVNSSSSISFWRLKFKPCHLGYFYQTLLKLEKEAAKENSKTPKYRQKIQACDDTVKSCEQKLQQIKADINSTSERVLTLEPKFKESELALEEAKKALRFVQSEQRKQQTELKNHKNDHHILMEKIEDLRNEAQRDYEGERRKREARICELEASVDEARAQLKTTEHRMEQHRAQVDQLKADSYKMKSDVKDGRNNLHQSKRNLKDLEDSRQDRYKRFGQHMPQMVKEIKQAVKEGAFHAEPLGPIGTYVTCKKPALALPVEMALGKLMTAWCVTDHHDEFVLRKIFQRSMPQNMPKPVVVCSQFQNTLYDISAGKPSIAFPTVFDLLSIQHPMISNALIDQCGIERALVINDLKKAVQVMREKPANVSVCYTAAGDTVYNHPTIRTYAGQKNRRVQYLSNNLENDIRQAKDVIAHQEQEVQRLESEMKANEAECRSNVQKQKESQNRVNALISRLRKMEMEISEMKSIEDPPPIDVATLVEDANQLEQTIADLQEKVAPLSDHVKTHETRCQEAQVRYDALNTEIRDIVAKNEPMTEELASTEVELERVRGHRKHYAERLKQHAQVVKEAEQSVETYREKMQADLKKAEDICERIDTTRSADSLQSEIQQIEHRIEEENRTKGNREEVTLNYQQKLQTYNRVRKEVQGISRFLTKLSQILQNRKASLDGLKRSKSLSTNVFFMRFVGTRNYRGRLHFSHSSKQLRLEVEPHVSEAGEGSKDLKALSGGERSFSTICFIMALWEAIESPFRCLDEFDVFMDLVNRRIAMDLMMMIANRQRDKQFIFLTPQDMSNLQHQDIVRIFRMPTPERGQTTLPFRSSSS
ncbi:hypothetical protein CAPTEDRAFT_218959 [Capitella teleta]|uniref:RecF/RecN/SMC N-terminal domain-containing protein n=1 Tax=Capitella teleta TaxID=283909 RepID=R7UBU0_CAPTE|nr:hypothetical protein CAPTEDRAFT_218959 [Capitella teleta]|eukprot:ELU03571.1 hypothetical protein CAPTEDRAFT_218959 [Capitella teleta]